LRAELNLIDTGNGVCELFLKFAVVKSKIGNFFRQMWFVNNHIVQLIRCFHGFIHFSLLPPSRRLCFRQFLFVCLSVCLCVSKITQKVMDGFFWNFDGMSGMA